MEDDHITFEGIDGAECERFVQQIRRKARASSRSKDTDWIVELVSTCMSGAALRWYIQLDSEIADDWAKLQKAMMTKWPASDSSAAPGRSSSIPTPAAAPEPSPAASAESDIIPAMSSLRALYVSSTISRVPSSSKAAFGTCSDRAQALRVQFTQGCAHVPTRLTMLNSSDGARYLAVSQDGRRDLGPRSSEWALLVSSDGAWSSNAGSGITWEAIWSVCPIDNSIRVIWSAAGSDYLLTSVLSYITKRLVFVSNAIAFREQYRNHAVYNDADLVFEAM
ncbi:hypothetical protein FRB90_003441 [Tulasnella sp. 427]|nr:hypothetical protein FRB90_003441 [Tulasnella sp. 427]